MTRITLTQLRTKHPKFIYHSYTLERQHHTLKIQHHFILEPDIIFKPEQILPLPSSESEIHPDILHNLAFHLGMIETLSYWKAACPSQIIIKAGHLTPEQLTWWKSLYLNGLGEFYFKNNTDFTQPDFLTIKNDYQRQNKSFIHQSETANGDLIMVGGGKDSAVTLEVLKDTPQRKQILMSYPRTSSLKITDQAGFKSPLVVHRTIYPKLLELNKNGYLNGHTPFSVYLAFLGISMGIIHDYKYVIVSNESSASEVNITFHGKQINHQYSKSYEFEKSFREYSKEYLSRSVEYFSFLRPLLDMQISKLFAKYKELHPIFQSCNVYSSEKAINQHPKNTNKFLNSWCGKCPKCAFTYMSLFPYIEYDEALKIFGNDYFLTPEIQTHIKDLVGLGKHKPFECVGTQEESILAIGLSIQKYRDLKKPIPPILPQLEKDLNITPQTTQQLKTKVNHKWDTKNFLPKEHAKILKKTISNQEL